MFIDKSHLSFEVQCADIDPQSRELNFEKISSEEIEIGEMTDEERQLCIWSICMKEEISKLIEQLCKNHSILKFKEDKQLLECELNLINTRHKLAMLNMTSLISKRIGGNVCFGLRENGKIIIAPTKDTIYSQTSKMEEEFETEITRLKNIIKESAQI